MSVERVDRPRRSRHLFGSLGLVGLIGVAPLLSGLDVRPAAAAGSLTLVDAPLTVGVGDVITLDVRLPSGAGAPLKVDVSVRPVEASTTPLTSALVDTTSPPTDTVHLGPSGFTVAEGVLRVAVPSETENADAARLALPQSGTYAVAITVPTVGSISVPIIRRAVDAPAPAVPFGVAVDVDAPLSLQPDGTTSIVTTARAAVTRLVSFLASTTVPVSLLIRPELLDSLERSPKLADRELVKRLAAASAPHRVLSVPYLHIDPSIAANAGASDEFTAQLRLGEDALNRLLGRLPDRRVWLATDPLSPAGAELVRDLGAQVLAEAAGIARDIPRKNGSTVDSLSPVLVPATVDDELALAEGDAVRTAHRIAVELLLGATGGGSGSGAMTSVFLKPDLATANLDVLKALVALTAEDDSLRAVDIVRIGMGIVQTVTDSAPLVTDFSAARARRAKLEKVVAATSAVIPTNDPRRVEWSIRAAVLLDTRLADDERAAYETQLRADLLAVQNNIVLLTARTVSLGDRDANIPVTLENRNDVTVSVTVRLVSSKLKVPARSEIITLEPGASTTMRIPVTARSNGRFPVTAQMLAPGTKTVVGKSAVINVRVGRLTGLGLVFTFAAGLALLSWWVQHLRRRLRREETKELERRKLAGLPVDDFDDIIVVDDMQADDGSKPPT